MSGTRRNANKAAVAVDYSIWPLAYCQDHMPQDFFGGAGLFSDTGRLDVPMIYTLLVGGEIGGKQHVALVDCGHTGRFEDKYGFTQFENPTQVLSKVGYRPEDVEHIFVSHMHFDHISNLRAFPNAKVYVQFEEYIGWTKAVESALQNLDTAEEREWVFSSFDKDDLVYLAQLLVDGRLVFLQGDQELLPGITAHLARENHTFGSQFFTVETRNGPYVVAGDTVYWYSNLEKMWPAGYVQGNTFNQFDVFLKIRKIIANDLDRIIPGHEPKLVKRHPYWVTESGNFVAEVHLRESDVSRKPQKAHV